MAKPVKVLICDDSIFFRKALERGLSTDPEIEVVGVAASAAEARELLKTLKPDLLTLDIEMPRMNGVDFLKELMQTAPLPVIMVSSLDVRVFDILAAGAIDFCAKPKSNSPADTEEFYAELREKIKGGAKAKLRVPTAKKVVPKTISVANATASFQQTRQNDTVVAGAKVIAIGASTGGTEAIVEVVKNLPTNLPGIVVVQHMPEGFTRMFAERLNKLAAVSVKEAENGDPILPGTVLIAPGGLQLSVEKKGMGLAVKVAPGPKVSGHCPSVDHMFHSVAANVGKFAVGVILTGMGGDGAEGLLAMRNAGAYTIGQDKESCVVYGMPMVAYNKGAVCKQLTLTKIGNEIVRSVGK